MSAQSSSPSWPLLAKACPRLQPHVRMHSQQYRGAAWYLLRDQVSGRHLRFSAAAYAFVARLDGECSVEEIYQKIPAVPGKLALTQDEVVLLLTQLFAMDLLCGELPGEAKEFFSRYQHERRLRRQRGIMNPLAIRVPLLDPDAILNRFMPWVRPLFCRTAVVLWLFAVSLAAVLALTNWEALSAAADSSRVLRPANLVLMFLIFVLIKLVHEFAHAFTVKLWGGEVHEMGITLLVFAPVPYVDASAAWGIRDKYKRALVGAVGVLVELFIAALALFLWWAVEPGLVRDAAFNALLISSISTLLFNANPLLRFDGYYVLQDLIEIPNLYARASRYYLYLIQRYILGIDAASSPVVARGEAAWFAVYGLCALIYRLFILGVIVLFLAEHYLMVGVALGAWAVVTQLLMPLYKGGHFLVASPLLVGRRARAVGALAVLAGVFSAQLMFVPVSLSSRVEGVVWVADQGLLHSGANGFVEELLVPSGTAVRANTPLVRLRALALDAQIEKLEARQRELEVRGAAERIEHRVQSPITQAERAAIDAELALLREQQASLVVRSASAGLFVLPDQHRFLGRFVRQGELIGYVINAEQLLVRAVVPQSKIGLIRQQVRHVEVRFAERLGEPVSASLARETPAGSRVLPSRALGSAGGGAVAVSALTGDGLTAAEEVFHVDLMLPANTAVTGLGERAYVRFDHGAEPLLAQWLRQLRQLLLRRLAV